MWRAQDELSGADIKAMCTEAGLLALRERRMRVTQADFSKSRDKVRCRADPVCSSASARQSLHPSPTLHRDGRLEYVKNSAALQQNDPSAGLSMLEQSPAQFTMCFPK